MLNPGNQSTLNTDKLDREEIMNYVRKHHLFENTLFTDINDSPVINENQIMGNALQLEG